jgi:hypothetical protein
MALGNGATVNASNSIVLGNTSIAAIYAEVTSITSISDGRVKDNIKANVPGLDFITRLRPVTYHLNIHRQNELANRKDSMDWEGKYDVEKLTQSGFIAQEVDSVARAIGYDFSGVEKPTAPGGLYGLKYGDFMMPVVKSIQEQQQTILNLKQENQALKSDNQKMIKQIAELQKQSGEVADLAARLEALEAAVKENNKVLTAK